MPSEGKWPKGFLLSQGEKSDSSAGKKGDGHETMVADFETLGMSLEAQTLSERFYGEVFYSEEGLAHEEVLLGQEANEPSSDQNEGGATDFSRLFGSRFEVDDSRKEVYTCAAEQPAQIFCELNTRAVPDTAYRKTLIGQQVFAGIEIELKRRNLKWTRIRERNQFRFGNNGSVETC